MIFAHLILRQQAAALSFLDITMIENKNGFEVLLPLWVDFSESFSNEYSNKAR